MKKVPVIDTHAHLIPDKIGELLPPTPRGYLAFGRQQAQNWLAPWTNALHRTQSYLRFLPNPVRKKIDAFTVTTLAPGLLVEGTAEDLVHGMLRAGVDYSMVIAHPPVLSNMRVFDECKAHPQLLPIVNIPSGSKKPGELLKEYAAAGAKALKMHPASDGEGCDSPRYRALLDSAADLGIPVIIHTGCVHSHIMYKDPDQGQAQRFSAWYEKYSSTPFILAHMNMHEPHVALDLAEAFPNVWLETSWQPTESIAEAVRRVGSERILFGSDWPFIGNNQRVGLHRIEDAVAGGMMTVEDADRIRGLNALKLFKIETDHAE